MSRFNNIIHSSNKIINNAWWIAYKQEPEMELFSAVVSWFFNDGYYEWANERLERIKNLIELLSETNPEFLFWLAEKVRKEYNMRTTSHILIAEISQALKWKDFNIASFVSDSIERVDDMTEILSYLLPEWKKNKKARAWYLTHWLLKWIWRAFHKFDEYQLAKYDRKWLVNLKDVIRLSHIKWDLVWKVLNDELVTPDTWEVLVSAISKEDLEYVPKVFNIWKKLQEEKKLPYMALLKNLRNIMYICDKYASYDNSIEDSKEQAEVLMSSILEYLQNEKAVENSKQLPFRYLVAYKEIREIPSRFTVEILKAIENAATFSIKNMKIDWTIAVFADVSWSMQERIAPKSSIMMLDIWLLFSWMITQIGWTSVAWIFWDIAKIKPLWTSIFSMNNSYKEWEVWYSTNWYKAIDLLIEQKIIVDNIMIFTDEELYDSERITNSLFVWESSSNEIEKSLSQYRKELNKNVKVFIFDLSWNWTKVSNHWNVYTISWWSDKVLEYVRILDSFNDNTIIKEIENNWKKYLNGFNPLEYVPDYLGTRKLCKIAVIQDWCILEYVPKYFKTEEICKLAVTNNWHALKYVPECLKTKELCKIAVTQEWYALEYVPERLKTEEVCKLAITNNLYALKYVSEEFKTE